MRRALRLRRTAFCTYVSFQALLFAASTIKRNKYLAVQFAFNQGNLTN
jgi:hypothetical protein